MWPSFCVWLHILSRKNKSFGILYIYNSHWILPIPHTPHVVKSCCVHISFILSLLQREKKKKCTEFCSCYLYNHFKSTLILTVNRLFLIVAMFFFIIPFGTLPSQSTCVALKLWQFYLLFAYFEWKFVEVVIVAVKLNRFDNR